MNKLDLVSLRHFVAVCDTGSVTRAAEVEHVVSSAVSKRVAQLEDVLKVQLISRSRRGMTPTPAGQTLLEHARAIIKSTQRIEEDMAGYSGGLKGKVRLLATASAVAESLSDDVAAFMKQPEHQEIQVDIEEDVSRNIVRRILEGSASLGVMWDATDLQGLRSSPYRSDHLVIVVHPDHPLAAHTQCCFEQVLHCEFVGLNPSSATSLMMERIAAMASKSIRYRAQVSNFEAALRVVRADLGIAVVPKEAVKALVKLYGLKTIALTDAWAKRQFVLCYRGHDVTSQAAHWLMTHLEALGQNAGRR